MSQENPAPAPSANAAPAHASDHKSIEQLEQERVDAFVLVLRAARFLAVSKFGNIAKSLKLKLLVGIPTTDGRMAGDGIRYYQVTPPTERLRKNVNVPEGRENIHQGVSEKGEVVKTRDIDADEAWTLTLNPILPNTYRAFVECLLGIVEVMSGGKRSKTFGKYAELMGFTSTPVLTDDGKTMYNKDGSVKSNWTEVDVTTDLKAQIDEVIAKRNLTIPAPMDWQNFEASRTATRGKVACPTPQCPSGFAVSEAQNALTQTQCKQHKQWLVYTPPAGKAAVTVPSEGPTAAVA